MNERLTSYLFVIDSSQNKLPQVIEEVDKLREVENWQTILPDAAVLVSSLEVQQLNAKLREVLPKQRFLLTVLERGKKQGWLARTAWSFMNKPMSVAEASS